MIKAYLYDGKGHDHEIKLSRSLPRLSRDRLLWVDVQSPSASDRSLLRCLFQLKSGIRVDGANSTRRPQLSTFGTHLSFPVVAILPPGKKLEAGGSPATCSITYLFSEFWLVTLHDAEVPYLTDFRKQDRGETMIGGLTGAGLVSSLLDWHLETYLTAANAIETFCDDIDLQILAGSASEDRVLRRIVAARRHAAHLLNLLEHQRPVFYGLSRADIEMAVDEDARARFETLARRYDRSFDVIQSVRNLIRGSFDLHAASLAESTNALVRRLTLLSVVLGIVGAVAGIFGMNFETRFARMGETGFWMVLAVLAMTVAGLISILRWRKLI